MTDSGASAEKLEARAHDLYWNSDRSVNGIAEDLGLSKGRLYQFVHPLPAGGRCPECGRALAFENRTARDRDEATCPHCGPVGRDRAVEGREAVAARMSSLTDEVEVDTRKVLAGAVLGAAAGFVLFTILRR